MSPARHGCETIELPLRETLTSLLLICGRQTIPT